MTDTTQGANAPGAPSGVNKLYFAAWRWHFYAGLYVIPFLIMLAVTGALMVWFTAIAPEYGDMIAVDPGETALSVTEQIAAAEAAHPGSRADKFITPYDAATPALVRVQAEGGAQMLAVDPYSGAILADRPEAGTWNEWLTNLHGEVLLGGNGGWGDLLVEIAASLGMLMVASGLYLAWPRNGRGLRDMLVPDLRATGRAFWKSLHTATGTWIAVVLAFFLLSGLAWAGIWGGRFVQPWSTFPAEKWDAVPLSDATHASMNHTAREEVPWTLELAPLPESGSQAGVQLLPEGTPITFETVVAAARALGFDARVQVTAPADETGVWSLSRDSMSYDSPDPTADRTAHIDRYTGRVLADVRYADYPVVGKAMAVGIALHEGQMGLWNVVLNLAFCALVVLTSVAGVVMWWKRRPAGAGRLAAPPVPADVPMVKGAVLITLALSLAFPVLGLTLLAVIALDILVLSPIPALKRALS
jgi:uncharacterized iron-regulated membrane protein